MLLTMGEVRILPLNKMFPKTVLVMAALSGTCLAHPIDHSEKTSLISDFWNNSIYQSGGLVANNSAEPYMLLPRSIITAKSRLWPEGVVPYEVDERIASDDFKIQKIGKAIKLFDSVSCVRWVKRTTEEDYVRFTWSEHKCSSLVGKVGSCQLIKLTDNCFHNLPAALVHEMMHTLGFIHEQQRDDRDCYIKLTLSAKSINDIKITWGTDTLWPYDYHSIMQYPETDYMHGRHGEKLGNYAKTLTQLDRDKLNFLYCGQPHYCDRFPLECNATEEAEKFCRVNKLPSSSTMSTSLKDI